MAAFGFKRKIFKWDENIGEPDQFFCDSKKVRCLYTKSKFMLFYTNW